jgi:1-acyl-sn-glycerol-3-phosphate acyltransferase
MKPLRIVFITLYRIWFYILVTIPIILLFPILLISISRDNWYPYFFRIARFWAKFILAGMGFYVVVARREEFQKRKSYMYVANHTSMIDIMLMLYVTDNPFVFVGKKELAKIPLFGFFYKRTCILVDRENPKSRREVFSRAQEKLNQGLSVCIFPEGGVPDESILLDEFKDGAFRLAIEHQISIAPMTFHDNKKRFPYTFLKGGPGKMRVTIHPILSTTDLHMDEKRSLKKMTREVILRELQSKV